MDTIKRYTRRDLDKMARRLAEGHPCSCSNPAKINWSIDFLSDEGQEVRVLLSVTWPGGSTNEFLD